MICAQKSPKLFSLSPHGPDYGGSRDLIGSKGVTVTDRCPNLCAESLSWIPSAKACISIKTTSILGVPWQSSSQDSELPLQGHRFNPRLGN